MLRVSDAQYAALEAYFAEEFVDQMTRQLFLSFPAECKAKGKRVVTNFVHASIERAREKRIGATLESDYRRYVVTEFVLGIDETKKIVDAERARILARDGQVDPTILIFLTYQAMLAKLMPEGPPPPPDPEYEAIA